MTIDLSSEFSSSDKIRVAVYLSPYSGGNDITGKSVIISEGELIPRPPQFGMGTIGYKIAWIQQSEYEALRGWLKATDPKKAPKLDFEKGRYLYVGGQDVGSLIAGDIVHIPYKITLQEEDRLMDNDGALIVEIQSHQLRDTEAALIHPVLSIRI